MDGRGDGHGYLYPLEWWDRHAELQNLIVVDDAGDEWGPEIPDHVVASLLVQNMERPPWWRELDVEKNKAALLAGDFRLLASRFSEERTVKREPGPPPPPRDPAKPTRI